MTNYDTEPGDREGGPALRASMIATVSDFRMPAGLLDRAMSRNRKRRTRSLLTGAISATAVAAAVAAVVAIVPSQFSGRRAVTGPTVSLRAQTAAFVLRQTAAAQVNSHRMISVERSGGAVTYTDVATQQQREVSGIRDSAGQPLAQFASSAVNGVSRDLVVEYQHHVYARYAASCLDHGVRATVSSFLPLQDNADPAVAFQNALRKGVIKVVGHRQLNGRDTILLSIKSVIAENRHFPAHPPTLVWIDARTYLVAQTEQFTPKYTGTLASGIKATWRPFFNHVTWLPPTPGNLALLTLTPPAGFTKMTYPDFARKYMGAIS